MVAATKALALSIDLDDLACYRAIHGRGGRLGKRPRTEADILPIYRTALPRFRHFCEANKARATLFLPTIHLDFIQGLGAELRAWVNDGYEVASHSHSHPYALTRLPRGLQQAEVAGSGIRIAEALGAHPKGFRAPGYTLSTELARIIREAGFHYDASLMRSPVYVGAKGVAISLKWLQSVRFQRRSASASILGDPRVLCAPTLPYRMDEAAFHRRGSGLLEWPISCTPTYAGAMPWIGTLLALLPERAVRQLARTVAHRSALGIEFHAIDFLEASEFGGAELKRLQPELRVPLNARLARYAIALAQHARDGFAPGASLQDAFEQVDGL